MSADNIYSVTFNKLRSSHNQTIEMTLADLLDELEKLDAMPKETIWQMRLALMHRDQELITNLHLDRTY